MVSDAAKKKAAAKKLKNTAKLQGKDAADKQAAAMSTSAVRTAAFPYKGSPPQYPPDKARASHPRRHIRKREDAVYRRSLIKRAVERLTAVPALPVPELEAQPCHAATQCQSFQYLVVAQS